MHRRPPRRLGVITALLAIVLPIATLAVAPAAEAANLKRHDVVTYKREGWVAVAGTGGANTAAPALSCDPGDHAVDGMWKIDAHDSDPRGLQVLASHGDGGEPETWQFRLVNAGAGRAQIKLFVTCLAEETGEANWHRHDLVISSRTTEAHPGLSAGLNELEQGQGCRSDQIPVAPGFDFTSGAGVVAASLPSADRRSWQWRFVTTGAASVTLSLRCLDQRTTPSGAGGHVHEIDGQLSSASGGQVDLASGLNDRTVTARKQDDGLVGAFSLPEWSRVAYLGQDPQGQVRGFRFRVDEPATSSAFIGVWGVDRRTSRQLAP